MNQIIPEIIYPANREKYTIMIYQAKNFCVKRAKICTSPGPAAASKYQKYISIKSCPVKSFVQNKQSSASSPVHFCFSVTNLLHIVFVLFHFLLYKFQEPCADLNSVSKAERRASCCSAVSSSVLGVLMMLSTTIS